MYSGEELKKRVGLYSGGSHIGLVVKNGWFPIMGGRSRFLDGRISA